jgi:hypothetical protein
MTGNPYKTTAHPRQSDCPHSHYNFEHAQLYDSYGFADLWISVGTFNWSSNSSPIHMSRHFVH